MNKAEFKERWESNESGGGITFDEIATAAIDWNVCNSPKTSAFMWVMYQVLKAAETNDFEEFKPVNEDF